jgi:hypothetical protein
MSHLYPQLIDLVFWYNNNVVQLAISDVVPSRLTDFGLAKMGLRGGPGWYPLVICYIAIENGHRNSEFSHEKW